MWQFHCLPLLVQMISRHARIPFMLTTVDISASLCCNTVGSLTDLAHLIMKTLSRAPRSKQSREKTLQSYDLMLML